LRAPWTIHPQHALQVQFAVGLAPSMLEFADIFAPCVSSFLGIYVLVSEYQNAG